MSDTFDLETKLGSLSLPCCIYNASGPRTGSIEALGKIGASASGAILSKSATLLKQSGNPLPRFVNKIDLGSQFCSGSMNSEGLPNAGIDYYIGEESIEMTKSHHGKPYIVSLSGLSLEDNLVMLDKCLKVDHVSSIELNLACPNIPKKPIIAYDFEQMDEVLRAITSHPLLESKPLGVKLAPYFDVPHFEKVIDIITKYPIKYVVTCNTIGNGLFVDVNNESAAIVPKGGFGGLGGGFIKPTALANVRMLSKLLQDKHREDIDIVGVGGVFTGRDAFELILCGAKAVQVGTCHWTEGPQCFSRIAIELKSIMLSKGYRKIEEFRGKLKEFDPSPSLPRSLYQTIDSSQNEKHHSPSQTSKAQTSNLIMLQWFVIVALVGVILSLVISV